MPRAPFIAYLVIAVVAGVTGAVAQMPHLRINEFMGSNATTIVDDDGDSSDWLELHNGGDHPIDLTDCYLSDDPDDALRWRFPCGSIPAGGHLIVWASNKDRVSPTGELHTNFAISADGEPLLVTAADGVTRLDEAPAMELATDVSYGRQPDGAASWVFFFEPTPGGPNDTAGYPEYLESPGFSAPGGWYAADLALEISTDHPDAVILYTLDGSAPDIADVDSAGTPYLINYFYPEDWQTSVNLPRTNNTHIYTGPIAITEQTGAVNDLSEIITSYLPDSQGVVDWRPPLSPVFRGVPVRARVYHGGNQSPVATATYFVSPGADARYDLPVVSLTTDPRHLFGYVGGIYVPGSEFFDNGGSETHFIHLANYFHGGDEWERPVHFELFGDDGSLDLAQNLGVRIHGSGSRDRPMKGLKFYARGEYDPDDSVHHPLIPGATDCFGEPLTDYKRFLLRTGGNEMNVLTDLLAHRLMSAGDVTAQRGQPVAYFINGEYWGLGNLRERQDEHHLERVYHVDPDDVVILDSPWGQGVSYDVEVGELEDLWLYRDMFNFVVDNDMSDPANYAQVQQLMDVLSYIDYNVMFIYLRNIDWYGEKHFGYWRVRDPGSGPYEDGRWRFLVWDFDSSMRDPSFDLLWNFIHPTGGGNGYNAGDPDKTALLRGMLDNPEFRTLFLNRFADHINTTFSPARFEALADEAWDAVASGLAEHHQRWRKDAATTWRLNLHREFMALRPAYQRQHIRDHFDLAGEVDVTLNVAGERPGHLRINTIAIDPGTPGVPDDPYPWTGVYFQGVPITVTACPDPGSRFVGWQESGATDPTVSTVPGAAPITLTAVFAADTAAAVPVHYWHFNDLPSGELSEVAADLALVAGAAITYPGSGAGYLDRVDPGTDLGAILDSPAGLGLRARNPSSTRELAVALPTTGYENLSLAYAVMRTSNGAQTHAIEYRTSASGPWLALAPALAVSEEYQHVTRDLANLDGAVDNAEFAIRFVFGGSNAGGSSGNQRFDNLLLRGSAIAGANGPPQIVGALPRQQLIEGGENLVIDLRTLFADPEDDPLLFTTDASHASVDLATAGSTLTVTPRVRGDALITISASDGHHAAIATTFRVLVFPRAADLSDGQEVFSAWDPDLPERVYPEHMLFLQSDGPDPALTTPLLFPYDIPHDDYDEEDAATIGFPYNNTRRTRINGLGTDGIAFLNTGRDRDLGGALLALDTRDVQALEVAWLAGTISPNERVYAIRLQCRCDLDAEFTDVQIDGQPVEYQRAEAAGHTQMFGPLTLPADLLDRPYVQLLWRYYHVAGTSGPRAQLRLDDISVRSDAMTVAPPPMVPDATALHGNAPNPFNPATTIRFAVGAGEVGTLAIHDSRGKRIASLGRFQPGEHTVTWSGTSDDGQRCASGIYFYRLRTASTEATRKMTLIQ